MKAAVKFSSVHPTLTFNKAWIYAYPRGKFIATTYMGKWIVYRPWREIDKLWARIKTMTEEGRLGIAAKVTTLINVLCHEGTYVACVYTRDWRDQEDVERVLTALRNIGVTERLYYKTDDVTKDKLYVVPDVESVYSSNDFEGVSPCD